jgi:hypothetical protein
MHLGKATQGERSTAPSSSSFSSSSSSSSYYYYSYSSSIGTTTLSWVSARSTIIEHSQQESFTECRC